MRVPRSRHKGVGSLLMAEYISLFYQPSPLRVGEIGLPLRALSQSSTSFSRAARSIFDCAHRTSTFSYQSMALPSLLTSLSWKDTHVGLSAAVERGPSEGARSGSTGPMWVSFHPPHRARSASKRAPGPPFSIPPRFLVFSSEVRAERCENAAGGLFQHPA